jgi:hypothetical protein
MVTNMKNLIFIIGVILLTGCEKYELESNPQLNLNGSWGVVDVKVVIDKVNYGSGVSVLNDTMGTVYGFTVDHINSDGTLVLTQNFNRASEDRRFIENNTIWEFDYNRLMIFENGVNVIDNNNDSIREPKEYIFTTLPCTYCTKRTVLEWDYKGNLTRYTFSTDTYGAMPANELILISQEFVTNIMLGGHTYDKAIISHLVITLHK